jgi:hypothetical protein
VRLEGLGKSTKLIHLIGSFTKNELERDVEETAVAYLIGISRSLSGVSQERGKNPASPRPGQVMWDLW